MVAFSRPLSAPLIKESEGHGGGSYRIDIKGREALYGVQGPCAVVTIFGDLRWGKTWLLNYLMRRQEMLKVTNRATETKGVDVALPRLTGSQFASTWGVACHANAPGLQCEMLFLDVEGQGDRDSSHDYTVLPPAALVSDIIIMNVPRYPGRDQVLNKLNLLYQLTRRLQGAKESTFKLGHVHLVCRDYTNMQSAEEIHREIMSMEPERRGPDARKRNEIRRGVEEWFESVSVHLLPVPSDPKLISSSSSLPFNQVSASFEAGVRALAQSIVHQLQGERGGLLGTEMAANGPLICEAMHSLLERVHEEGIDVPEVVDAMFQKLIQGAVEAARAEVEKQWPYWERQLSGCKDEQAVIDLAQLLCLRGLEEASKGFESKLLGLPKAMAPMVTAAWNGIVADVHNRFELVQRAAIAKLREVKSEDRRVQAVAQANEAQSRVDEVARQLAESQDKMKTLQEAYAAQMMEMKEEARQQRESFDRQIAAMQEAIVREANSKGNSDLFGFLGKAVEVVGNIIIHSK